MLADLTNRPLDRVGVFKKGQEERRWREWGGAGKILDNGALAVVIVTKLPIAKGGRSALRSVRLDVLALGDWISGHYDCSWNRLSALSYQLSVNAP